MSLSFKKPLKGHFLQHKRAKFKFLSFDHDTVSRAMSWMVAASVKCVRPGDQQTVNCSSLPVSLPSNEDSLSGVFSFMPFFSNLCLDLRAQ